MDPSLGASPLLKRLGAYRAEHDESDPVRFVDLAKQVPYFDGTAESLLAVRVADFAELAYCPYTIWHNIRGTPEVRPRWTEIALAAGKGLHVVREATALERVAKAKVATKRQLRDPRVDLVELPEFPGCFRRDRWLYRAKLDGLSREGGNLVVHELKTGRHAEMPDQMLQVWAYCMASPGAMTKATGGDLRANGVSWVIEYSGLGKTWGPFEFRTAQLDLLTEAMTFYETTGLASTTDNTLNLGWRSFPAKCAPCGFAHACPWKVEPRPVRSSEAPRGRLISLDQYLEPEKLANRTDGSVRGHRHRNHRARAVRKNRT